MIHFAMALISVSKEDVKSVSIISIYKVKFRSVKCLGHLFESFLAIPFFYLYPE